MRVFKKKSNPLKCWRIVLTLFIFSRLFLEEMELLVLFLLLLFFHYQQECNNYKEAKLVPKK